MVIMTGAGAGSKIIQLSIGLSFFILSTIIFWEFLSYADDIWTIGSPASLLLPGTAKMVQSLKDEIHGNLHKFHDEMGFAEWIIYFSYVSTGLIALCLIIMLLLISLKMHQQQPSSFVDMSTQTDSVIPAPIQDELAKIMHTISLTDKAIQTVLQLDSEAVAIDAVDNNLANMPPQPLIGQPIGLTLVQDENFNETLLPVMMMMDEEADETETDNDEESNQQGEQPKFAVAAAGTFDSDHSETVEINFIKSKYPPAGIILSSTFIFSSSSASASNTCCCSEKIPAPAPVPAPVPGPVPSSVKYYYSTNYYMEIFDEEAEAVPVPAEVKLLPLPLENH